MYFSLTFVMLPAAAVVFDTLWPILLIPLLFLYLQFVVIAAEEKLLAASFGAAYTQYTSQVARWLLCF